MKLELAQFREVAAFAQFGSDLDAATQQQLLRGSVLMELLKQKLFVPMPVTDMALSLFSGSFGHLDKVPVKRILEFEKAWLEYMHANHKDFVGKVTESGNVTKEDLEFLDTTIKTFVGETDFYVKQAI